MFAVVVGVIDVHQAICAQFSTTDVFFCFHFSFLSCSGHVSKPKSNSSISYSYGNVTCWLNEWSCVELETRRSLWMLRLMLSQLLVYRTDFKGHKILFFASSAILHSVLSPWWSTVVVLWNVQICATDFIPLILLTWLDTCVYWLEIWLGLVLRLVLDSIDFRLVLMDFRLDLDFHQNTKEQLWQMLESKLFRYIPFN